MKLVRDFDEFLSQIDVITFHVPGGDQTRHLLNRDRLMNKCRPNLLVVNDSRGEVIDEIALAEALKEKKIAGAAIDVYATEPPAKDHPLFGLENVVLTPHLGASTDEAQTAVSVEACKAIVAYLNTGEIRGAVNAGGLKLDLPADEKPFVELARRIGRAAGRLVRRRISHHHASRQRNACPQAHEHAASRGGGGTAAAAPGHGCERHQRRTPGPRPGNRAGDRSTSRIRRRDWSGTSSACESTARNGESHRVLGTVYADGLPRVLRIDEYNMDMVPEGNMVLIVNKDQPGVIGVVGTSFGDAQVNIADMVISREFGPGRQGDGADGDQNRQRPPPEALLNRLKARPNILKVKSLVLPPRAK